MNMFQMSPSYRYRICCNLIYELKSFTFRHFSIAKNPSIFRVMMRTGVGRTVIVNTPIASYYLLDIYSFLSPFLFCIFFEFSSIFISNLLQNINFNSSILLRITIIICNIIPFCISSLSIFQVSYGLPRIDTWNFFLSSQFFFSLILSFCLEQKNIL